jgi:hypothetical protein
MLPKICKILVKEMEEGWKKLYNGHTLEGLLLFKYLYYWKGCRDSVKFLSNRQRPKFRWNNKSPC